MMEQFLQSVEKRAYRMACVATSDKAEALDIVQDAMESLIVKYAGRSEEEWKPLFFRILLNRITDEHRNKKRERGFLRCGFPDTNQTTDCVTAQMANKAYAPQNIYSQTEMLILIERAIASLPHRQQQVFMMRCWEGFSVKETARTLQIGEGSVKTHYSRALKRLQVDLEAFRGETR